MCGEKEAYRTTEPVVAKLHFIINEDMEKLIKIVASYSIQMSTVDALALDDIFIKLRANYGGVNITTAPQPQRYKIIESIPDKDGFIFIAIKPSINGEFGSRNEALDSIRSSYGYTARMEKPDKYCRADLFHYIQGNFSGEDIGLCKGKDCNWCGRYNEPKTPLITPHPQRREISEIHRIPTCPIHPFISLAECRGCEYNGEVEREHILCNCATPGSTTGVEKVLAEVFAPMDKIYGNITTTQIIEWSVKQQSTFITNATTTYLLARKLRVQEQKK